MSGMLVSVNNHCFTLQLQPPQTRSSINVATWTPDGRRCLTGTQVSRAACAAAAVCIPAACTPRRCAPFAGPFPALPTLVLLANNLH